jgi:acyl phosphate:glycerol-3-phosphate acyltransferase
MEINWNVVLGILCSYLLGSIPTAYIAGKILKGIDIREHGSGNVGATNVFRVLGKKPGVVVLIIDILKGVVAVAVIGKLLGLVNIPDYILLAIAVVCGHNWTVFLQFKGGKGIATSLGVLIGLVIQFPELGSVLLFTLLLWIALFLTFAYVSLASIVAALGLPILMFLTHQHIHWTVLGVIFSIFVIIRHKPNIKRLLSGQEQKVPLPFKK